jgi:hypothetical protein
VATLTQVHFATELFLQTFTLNNKTGYVISSLIVLMEINVLVIICFQNSLVEFVHIPKDLFFLL